MPCVGVEMMDDLQPSRMGLHQRLELGVEDHRWLVAVGVEQADLPLAGFERRLDQRHHGRDAAAAAEQQQRRVAVAQHEAAGRRQHVQRAAFLQRVVEPVGALAAGDALHRHLGQAVGLGRARQRIAAVEGAVGVRHLEGQELAGAVAELVGKVGGDFEDEGARIGRFLDDLGDAQLVVGHSVNPRSGTVHFPGGTLLADCASFRREK